MSTSTSGGLSTRTIVLSLVIGLGVLLALAFALGGGDEPAPTVDVMELPAATTTGDALPEFAGDPAADSAVGSDAPTATGPSLDGAEVTVGDGDGPTILLFLAHWCPHCQREAPAVQSWIEDGGLEGSDVELVGVATGISPDQANYPPDAWLQRIGWTAPTLIDNDGTVSDAFGLNAFPYWVVVEDGEVLLRFTGNLGTEGLDQLVADLERQG